MSKFENIYLKGKDIIDIIYPIGCIYMSFNNTDPGTLYEGTEWEQIEGKVLVSVDSNDEELNTSNITGGEKYHILTTNELPSHSHILHEIRSDNEASGYGLTPPGQPSGFSNRVIVDQNSTKRSTNAAGGGSAHNNMPPYVTVYMWKRIS